MQAKTQPETHLPTNPHTTASAHPTAMDPIQQLIQQMGGLQNLPTMQQPNIAPTPTPTQEDNPIKSLLRQLNVNTNGHPQATTHMDTVWPQPPPQMVPQFNAQNWLAQVRCDYKLIYVKIQVFNCLMIYLSINILFSRLDPFPRCHQVNYLVLCGIYMLKI